MWILLVFFGVAHAWPQHQDRLILKEAFLVALFLAGLVVLGSQQRWWLQPVLTSMSDHIKRLARISDLEFVEKLEPTKGAARTMFTGAEIAVPLEGLIDFDKERERLEKELGKLTNELAGLEKRLNNPDFVARAAAEVVADSRARAAELGEQLAKLRTTIDSL